MYDEDSLKSHLFWIKAKRIFFMIIFSILGCMLGVFISSYLVDILMFDSKLKIILIVVFTLIFFAISLLVTANTGKEVQDGYWKIAVLRKLTLISKKLDSLENLDKINELLLTLDTENLKKNSAQSNVQEKISNTDDKNKINNKKKFLKVNKKESSSKERLKNEINNLEKDTNS